MAILPISEMVRAREEGLPPRCRARISSEALTVPWTREPATILGLAAQIEREFISARTKPSLERRKAAGLPVGRPKGRATKLMLDDRRAEIVDYLIKGSANAQWQRFSAVHPPHSTPGSGADAFPENSDPRP